MYLLDPDQGRRRRALARDKMTKARRAIHERASGTASGTALGTSAREIQTPEGARHLGR
jgi:hypothetical protein